MSVTTSTMMMTTFIHSSECPIATSTAPMAMMSPGRTPTARARRDHGVPMTGAAASAASAVSAASRAISAESEELSMRENV